MSVDNVDITRTGEIVEAVKEWLKDAGVSVERDGSSQPADGDHPFELLVLSLSGEDGSPVQKMAKSYGVDGRLLVRWLLPIREEGGACSVIDLARRRRDGDRKWTFPPLFRMKAFDDARKQKRDGTPQKDRVHPLNLPPDLEAEGAAVYPAWWRDARLAWEWFAKRVKDLQEKRSALTPHDFAKLETRLNAVFVSSRARRGVRCFEDLPETARNYVLFIEEKLGVHISYVSVGAEREAIILR